MMMITRHKFVNLFYFMYIILQAGSTNHVPYDIDVYIYERLKKPYNKIQ